MATIEFIENVIFKGLTNHNDGFDAVGIKWFSKEDFEIILKRTEQYRLFISAIEHWPLDDADDCKLYYPVERGCRPWYFQAFEYLVKKDRTNLFSASFNQPLDFFGDISLCQDSWLYEW